MLKSEVDSCRIAFMSLAASDGGVVNPQFVSTWGDITEQAVKLRNCLVAGVSGQKPQGGYLPFRRTYQ